MGPSQRDSGAFLREGKPYYSSYDSHYRALYKQGIPYWSAGPNMDRIVKSHLEVIRKHAGDPAGRKILEIGCGEGFLGIILTGMGYQYWGIDYSKAAIAKARARAAEGGVDAAFLCEDVFDLSREVTSRAYDVVVDWGCLNCFVMDDDRRRYFGVVSELVVPGSRFILIHEALEDDARYDIEIASIKEWQALFENDLSELAEREGWDGEKWVPVALPHFVTRCKTEKGYVEEFQRAGFEVVERRISGSKDQHFNAVLTVGR